MLNPSRIDSDELELASTGSLGIRFLRRTTTCYSDTVATFISVILVEECRLFRPAIVDPTTIVKRIVGFLSDQEYELAVSVIGGAIGEHALGVRSSGGALHFDTRRGTRDTQRACLPVARARVDGCSC